MKTQLASLAIALAMALTFSAPAHSTAAQSASGALSTQSAVPAAARDMINVHSHRWGNRGWGNRGHYRQRHRAPRYSNRGPSFYFEFRSQAPRHRYVQPRYVQPRYVQPRHRGYALPASHVRWCYMSYRSYRQADNTFQPNRGPRRQCISPYY